MDKTKIDLNAPAFGAGAQKLEELINDAHRQSSVEDTSTEKSEVENEESSVEETKVPYSRFKKFHDEAIQKRMEAEEWKAKAEQLEQQSSKREVSESDDMPSYWRKLYGDSEVSQEAWLVQKQREEDIERRAYEAGQRGAQDLEYQHNKRIESNVETIDENFENLSDFVGREITAKEQSAILDIVDDFTPKDTNGSYAGPLIPFEKAWEMYELKQGSKNSSQRKDRDSVASLSGTSSQGDTSINEEQNKNWNPLARGSWRSRL